MEDTMKRQELNIMVCLAIAVMGTVYLSISRMPKNFAIFMEHAVQCILENIAANGKL